MTRSNFGLLVDNRYGTISETEGVREENFTFIGITP